MEWDRFWCITHVSGQRHTYPSSDKQWKGGTHLLQESASSIPGGRGQTLLVRRLGHLRRCGICRGRAAAEQAVGEAPVSGPSGEHVSRSLAEWCPPSVYSCREAGAIALLPPPTCHCDTASEVEIASLTLEHAQGQGRHNKQTLAPSAIMSRQNVVSGWDSSSSKTVQAGSTKLPALIPRPHKVATCCVYAKGRWDTL